MYDIYSNTPEVLWLAKSISDLMKPFESLGLRLSDLWVRPEEAVRLRRCNEFDESRCESVIAHLSTPESRFIGTFLGMQVFETEVLPLNHIALLPRGFRAELIGSEAGIPLGIPLV
jgi:hypothetical protein